MKSTVKVTGAWQGGYRTDVQGDGHELIIDQPENGGGKDEGPNPLQVFLFSLAGCLGTVAAIIAKQERIKLHGLDVAIEGDIDKDYLMGKTKEGRAGFTEIRVSVNIDADLTEEEKLAFFERVDSRCPISCNMINNSDVIFDVK
jgi:uncharacterized OsmC-like protein